MTEVRGIGIMNNAEWMIKQGKNFSELTCHVNSCRVNLATDKFEICLDSKIIGEIGIGSISKNPILVWLDQEHKEPILDDAEKRYLSAVIKPFRNEKLGIVKLSTCNGSEEWLNFFSEKGSFYLPNFKTGTMYKGMKQGKHYTPEELGL